MLVFIKNTLIPRITKVEVDYVKCGVKNYFGNKGGTIIKFFVDDTSLCFINVHLTAGNGKNNFSSRIHNINKIHEMAF